jgi:uncharacterized protein (DUF1778 family)
LVLNWNIVGFNFLNVAKLLNIFMEEQKKGQLNIELSEEIAEGIYSNLAIISHSNSEFVVDFVRMLPNLPKAKVKSRIILSPEHAKRLMRALQENIAKYESQFGKIKETDSPPIPTMNFNVPIAEA